MRRSRAVATLAGLLLTAAGCASSPSATSAPSAAAPAATAGLGSSTPTTMRTPAGAGSTTAPGGEVATVPVPAATDPPPGGVLDVGARTIARSPDGHVRLETVSSRAASVTGGDVLVDVRRDDPPGIGGETDALILTVDGRREPLAVAGPARDHHYQHIQGIGPQSVLSASFGGGAAATATLTVENHPTTGPLFAGPKPTPFVCANTRYGVPAASDADCSAASSLTWTYVTTTREVRPYPADGRLPADVATATVNGAAVPFVVREERGVLDRSVYSIAILDPHPLAGPGPTTTEPVVPGLSPVVGGVDPSGWNGRLVYRYGGGCGTTYGNGLLFTPTIDLELLAKGYATATSTLNTFQNLCNDVISAEVTAMVKEHFIETYGVPVHTLADGGSGGAIQQIQIAQNYPGLLDGLAPSLPFADTSSMISGITDCGLFDRYRMTTTGRQLTDAQWAAVTGFGSNGTCMYWINGFLGLVEPTAGCDAALTGQTYDPVQRPRGVRCTVQDTNVGIYGRDPVTGFARRPLDNTGVLYGFDALNARTISVEQFLALNAGVGGYDIDGVMGPARTTADEDTIRTAYASGQVTEGGGLTEVPIILRNLYTDPLGDIHDRVSAFALRDRLARPDGSPNPNVVLWTAQNDDPDLQKALTGNDSLGDEPLYVLDDWLTRRDAQARDAAAGSVAASAAEQLAAARPAAAVDRCTLDGQVIAGETVYDAGPCHDAFPIHESPRRVAGAPRRDDILKCATRPVDATVLSWFAVPFSAEQQQRLAGIFPNGVCDWSRPGIGQVPLARTWPRFG